MGFLKEAPRGVRARGLQKPVGNTRRCSPGALTGRVVNQALHATKALDNHNDADHHRRQSLADQLSGVGLS